MTHETVVLEVGHPEDWAEVARLTKDNPPGTITVAGMTVMFGWDRDGEGPAVWSTIPTDTIGEFRIVSARSVRVLFDITEENPFTATYDGPPDGLLVRIRLERLP